MHSHYAISSNHLVAQQAVPSTEAGSDCCSHASAVCAEPDCLSNRWNDAALYGVDTASLGLTPKTTNRLEQHLEVPQQSARILVCFMI